MKMNKIKKRRIRRKNNWIVIVKRNMYLRKIKKIRKNRRNRRKIN